MSTDNRRQAQQQSNQRLAPSSINRHPRNISIVVQGSFFVVVLTFLAAPDLLSSTPKASDRLDVVGIPTGTIQETEAVQTPAEEFDQAMKAGAVALQNGDNAGAIAAFAKAVQLSPDHPLALTQLGRAKLELGDFEEALDLLLLATTLAPDNFVTTFNLGTGLLRVRRYQEALGALDAAAQADPADPMVRYGQALALAELGSHADAITRLEEAVTLAPELANAWMLLGRLLIEHRGDLESVLRATAAYESALELRPRSGEACLALGRAYRRLTFHEKTLALVDECQAAGSRDPNLELLRGRALRQMGMPSEARSAFEAAAIRGSVEAHFELGVQARAQGDLDVAVKEFEAVVRMRPRRALAYVRLAEVHIDRLAYASAEELLRRVLRMQACCVAQAHNLLGFALYKTGDLDGAVAHGREAIKLNAELKQAHYNLALALRDSGKREQSHQVIQRFQELTDAEDQRELQENRAMQLGLLNAQGLYYFRRDDPTQALKLFETAVEFAPDDALIHLNIGLSKAALGQHQGAIVALERSLALQPERAETYTILAAAYRVVGQAEDAQRIDELRRQIEGRNE